MSNFQKVIKVLAICFAIFLIINIFGAIVFGITLFANITGRSNHEINANLSGDGIVESYDNVDKIDIELVASELVIKTGNELRVETENLNNDFSSKAVNGTLKIKENKVWFWNNNSSGKIILYIPQSMILRDLSIDTGAGTIYIDGINAEKLDIDHGAGLLEILNSDFEKVDIDGGAGRISIKSSTLNNLDLDAGVGRVDIEGKITGKSDINCGIGEMNVNIIGNEEEYTIKAEKGIGSIKINGDEQASNVTYGSGKNRIDLEGGIGSTNISFSNL